MIYFGKSGFFFVFVAFFALTACGTPAQISQIADADILEVKSGETAKPVQFRKIVVKMKRGEDIGSIQSGILCVPQSDLVFRGGRYTLENDELTEAFRDELEAANYTVVGDPDALFEDPDAWKAEFLVAGLVKRIQANICYPLAGFGNFSSSKGEASMEVNWQIYSRLDRQVVYETKTEGASKLSETSGDGESLVYVNAFAQAARNLLGKQEFHDLLTGKRADLAGKQPPEKGLTIKLEKTSNTPLSEHINDVRLGVVTVFAGDGHGSGFFVGGSGYLLTNEHVVRTAKFVKLKLATGREILGEVLATDPRRDVALIKAEKTGIPGLTIVQEQIPVGSTVFAIGSPLRDQYDSTVSRGIVSGYRVDEGINFIQSDVNVLPGSSGGPLLDENGNVLGVTVKGVLRGGSTTGLNFFVPINEALEQLGLKIDREREVSQLR